MNQGTSLDNRYSVQIAKLKAQLDEVSKRLAPFKNLNIQSLDMNSYTLYSDLMDQYSALQEAIWILED